MYLLMVLLLIGFVGVVYYMARLVVLQLEQKADEDVLKAKNIYQQIIEQKDKAFAEKTKLEREAAQIFTLYELMREITKKFDETEAFTIFKKKLKENVAVEDCHLVDVSLEKLKTIRNEKEYSIFPLKSKDAKLGYLAYKGIPDTDAVKFAILAHQFALALRRISLYKDIERLAITDSLTGVHTRRYFLERFDEEIQRSLARKIGLAFMMIDVDHFKSFNDQYGHLTGDRILMEFGTLIKDNIREIDIAGRYGGEEFCVVLPDTDLAGAQLAAERIRAAAEAKIIHAYDQMVNVTLSIGISTFPQNGKTSDELIDKADWALYRAKSQGRNCVVAFGMYQNGPSA